MRSIFSLAGLTFVLNFFATPLYAADGDVISFNRDIRPILSDRCYYCHGFDENHRAADLRLDIRDEAEYTWDVDSPEDSELIDRVTSDDPDYVMPPPDAHKPAITAEEAELLRRWIAEGAEYEAHWAFVPPRKTDLEDASMAEAIDHFVAKRQPTFNQPSFGRQPKAHATTERDRNNVRLQLTAKQATPEKWLRRASLDLTGLPPSADELRDFAKRASEIGERAYSNEVDRLLSSSHFGERMALEWLDVARYADTNGFQKDAYRMNWPWRDWVVRAFNDNLPYDQFITEQLAGDLLPNPSTDQLVATAFNRNHMINGEGGAILAENLAKNNFDRVETTGTATLGMTVGCSQCHDHKFDPITQADYYSLMAFFNQINETGAASKKFDVKNPRSGRNESYWVDRPFIEVADDDLMKQLKDAKQKTAEAYKTFEARKDEYTAAARTWILEMREDDELRNERIDPGAYVARFIDSADVDDPNNGAFKQLINHYVARVEPWKSLRQPINEATAAEAKIQQQIPLVMVMRDNKPRETFVLLRGNYESPGDKVTASTPEFLPPIREDTDDSSPVNRLDFARWLFRDDHPLTARVAVNRYWQMIFGKGIVETPDDFGLQGALPTHPDLLDWLAVDFRESGWDVKRLIKSMVLSRTYRQSAVVPPEVIAADPENKWLTRGVRVRLDSRLLRDQTLKLSGLLVDDLGGPPVFPYQPDGVWSSMSLGQNRYAQGSGDELYRRSLYTVWRRVVAPTGFFDVPSRQVCSVKPSRTNTPLHALTTLNDTTYAEAARVLAVKCLDREGTDQERLKELFFEATARQPTDVELATLEQTLHQSKARFEDNLQEASDVISVGETPANQTHAEVDQAAWTIVCTLVLNLDEVLSK